MGFKNNFYIAASSVMLIGEDGKPMGVMSPGKAKAIANDRDLPLVCVNPAAHPPVYRLGNPPKDGITTATVRLMGENGEQFGVISSEEARKIADERGLDIIVVAPNQDPQVARLGDRGKYEYEQKKKKRGKIRVDDLQLFALSLPTTIWYLLFPIKRTLKLCLLLLLKLT